MREPILETNWAVVSVLGLSQRSGKPLLHAVPQGLEAHRFGFLVDAEGKVASEVAVGSPAVMELAGATQSERCFLWELRWAQRKEADLS